MRGPFRREAASHVIGNHDTYPGERDRALWRKHFPDQPPYCACDLCGCVAGFAFLQ